MVGDYYTSTNGNAASHVLALIYNGTSLKPTPTVPLPKGTTNVALTTLSCATARYCVALGVAEGETAAFGDGSLTIIETWNGAKWTLHTVAAITGKASVELSGVSCATTAFCVLAGTASSFTSASFTVKLYAAAWNGKELRAMKTATVSSGPVFLAPTGVSCATASNCAVTGVDGVVSTGFTESSAAFTEIWNGKTWQLAKVTWPKGTADPSTLGVSCYTAHTCEVVGVDSTNDSQTSPYDATAVSLNGTKGQLQAVPAPSKGYSDAFASVSCLPWGSCVAIGAIGKTNTNTAPLMTGVWNGKGWKLSRGF